MYFPVQFPFHCNFFLVGEGLLVVLISEQMATTYAPVCLVYQLYPFLNLEDFADSDSYFNYLPPGFLCSVHGAALQEHLEVAAGPECSSTEYL